MTAFVILAAGRGTRIGRVGESLHKALVPLGNRAVISHLIALAPTDAHIVVAVGHRAEQVQEYLELAHPGHAFTFVHVKGYDQPGSGPGASLLATRDAVGDTDMIFTSCDTLWARDLSLWNRVDSWSAVAPIPAGTPYARWCRMRTRDIGGVEIQDKQPLVGPDGWSAYTGLSMIKREDLHAFWDGVERGTEKDGEKQVSGGLEAISDTLDLAPIHWTDVGDAEAYRSAVARWEGYDFTKPDEATYVLPEEGRVVKFWANTDVLDRRRVRSELLNGAVPNLIDSGEDMLAYEYVPGRSGYAACRPLDLQFTKTLLAWAESVLWQPVDLGEGDAGYTAALRFYRDKTTERLWKLPPELRATAQDAVSRVNWDELARGCRPARIHGDFNLGNIVVTNGGKTWRNAFYFKGIDWREDFAGELYWGDMRYDVAKLLAGMIINWDRAKTGDMRPALELEGHARVIREWWDNRAPGDRSVEIIGALSMLNSAPLHAAPLDEVLVARGSQWLVEVT